MPGSDLMLSQDLPLRASIPGDANGIYLYYLASKQQKRPLLDLLMVKKICNCATVPSRHYSNVLNWYNIFYSLPLNICLFLSFHQSFISSLSCSLSLSLATFQASLSLSWWWYFFFFLGSGFGRGFSVDLVAVWSSGGMAWRFLVSRSVIDVA